MNRSTRARIKRQRKEGDYTHGVCVDSSKARADAGREPWKAQTVFENKVARHPYASALHNFLRQRGMA